MKLGALILFCHDLQRSLTFYRALGLVLEEEHHDQESAGPKHYACELGELHFALFDGEGENPASGFRRTGATMPGFEVDSLEKIYEAIQELGAKVIEPPSEYPWGPRFLVEDPDGRTVEVFVRAKEEDC